MLETKRQGQPVHIWMDTELIEKLKVEARKRNLALSQLVRMWLIEKMEQK